MKNTYDGRKSWKASSASINFIRTHFFAIGRPSLIPNITYPAITWVILEIWTKPIPNILDS